MQALRDEFPEADRDDVELLTVSVDSGYALRAWAGPGKFEFGLLSDFWPHGGVARVVRCLRGELGYRHARHVHHRQSGVVRWKVVNPIPQARDIADYQKALASL